MLNTLDWAGEASSERRGMNTRQKFIEHAWDGDKSPDAKGAGVEAGDIGSWKTSLKG